MLTRAQISSFEKAIAASNNALARIEMLERLGSINPQLATRAAELRAKRDYLHQLAETALEFNQQMLRGSDRRGG